VVTALGWMWQVLRAFWVLVCVAMAVASVVWTFSRGEPAYLAGAVVFGVLGWTAYRSDGTG
jgi:hypothetical protein